MSRDFIPYFFLEWIAGEYHLLEFWGQDDLQYPYFQLALKINKINLDNRVHNNLLILKFSTILVPKAKYSSIANDLPMQFRRPTEKPQTFGSLTNSPFSSIKRSGMNFEGSGKFFGSCITADSAPRIYKQLYKDVSLPKICDFFGKVNPLTLVSSEATWTSDSAIGFNLLLSNKTDLVNGQFSFFKSLSFSRADFISS